MGGTKASTRGLRWIGWLTCLSVVVSAGEAADSRLTDLERRVLSERVPHLELNSIHNSVWCDIDGDGTEELVTESLFGEYQSRHLYRVYRKNGDQYEVVGEFRLEGMPQSAIKIIEEPDESVANKVVFVIQYNSTSGAYHLLSADGSSTQHVVTAIYDWQLDLDGDGIFEWVTSHKFNEAGDLFSNRLGYRADPLQVHLWRNTPGSYTKIWPLPADSRVPVGAVAHNMDSDSHAELVAIMGDRQREQPEKTLSILKLIYGRLSSVAELRISRSTGREDIVAIRSIQNGKQVIVRFPDGDEMVHVGCNYVGEELALAWENRNVSIENRASGIYAPPDWTEDTKPEDLLIKDIRTERRLTLSGSDRFEPAN